MLITFYTFGLWDSDCPKTLLWFRALGIMQQIKFDYYYITYNLNEKNQTFNKR